MSHVIVEDLCVRLYQSPSDVERKDAEVKLSEIFPQNLTKGKQQQQRISINGYLPEINTPAEAILRCQELLQQTQSPFVITYVIMYLRNIVTIHFLLFPADRKNSFCMFVLQLLYRLTSFPSFILNNAASLYALALKISWFDLDKSDRGIVENVDTFLKASSQHALVGLKIVDAIITEMSIPISKNHQRHRKMANSFRDNVLLKLFQTSLGLLKGLHENLGGGGGSACPIQFQTPEEALQAKQLCVAILLHSLSFDFIGTAIDDSSDDPVIVQLPSNWRQIVEVPENIQLFYDCYRSFPPHVAKDVMECLVLLISIRKSVFTDDEKRKQFLSHMISEYTKILDNNIGLDSADNFHGICRFLSRIKITYQLSDLMDLSVYNLWLEAATRFTIKGFQSWEWSPNSIAYLLTFWSKFVTSVQHQKTDSMKSIEEKALEISLAFVSVCIDKAGRWDDECPLENEENSIAIFESLASFTRCNYTKVISQVKTLFDSSFQQFSQLNTSAPPEVQKKITWLIYIIGSMVGSRSVYTAEDDHDVMDADLTHRVIETASFVQNLSFHYGYKAVDEKLHLAILYFLAQFRKVYLGDQSQRAHAFLNRLGTYYGQKTNDILIEKIISTIKLKTENRVVLEKAVSLFGEYATGYAGIKAMLKTDIVKQMLFNAELRIFPFLQEPPIAVKKLRTEYYATFSRLLFAEESTTTEEDFDMFMQPFDATIKNLLAINTVEVFRSDSAKQTLIGLYRDLRGFMSCILARKHFQLVVQWIIPSASPLFIKTVQAFKEDTDVLISFLRFYHEFAYNRSSRLNFDISSPYGILIFKETSNILCLLADHLMSINLTSIISTQELYRIKYKPSILMFNILSSSLAGKYVSFGVFKIYNDPAFEQVLLKSFHVFMTLPLEDVLAYKKLAQNLFVFIEIVTKEFLKSMPPLDIQIFLKVMKAVDEAIKCTDGIALQESCSILDNIATHIFTHMQSKKASSQNDHYLMIFKTNPDVFTTLLSTVFSAVLAAEDNMWTLSRPLLPLILINQQAFQGCVDSIANGLAQERKDLFFKAANKLVEDLENSLTTKNRDCLTANLLMFKRDASTALPEMRRSPSISILDTAKKLRSASLASIAI